MADAHQTPHPQTDVAASDIVSSGGFGQCRDCKHWLFSRRDMLAEYPKDRLPRDGYLDGVCPQLLRTLTITATGGWDGATVDSVETDANFGCVLFEPNEKAQP